MSLYLGENLLAGSFKTGASWEVGDIGQSALGIDESLNKRRYLNGQVISQTQFVQFTAWVKQKASVYTNLATTEENWQAEVTNSKLGQCGKFVIDDTAGTIRLPKVVNINGLQDLALMGGIKAESLPNIKGDDFVIKATTQPTGLLNTTGIRAANSSSGNTPVIDYATFDASRSSSTYQDNAPVQQEAVQYPYFIQVATGVEETVDVTREIELNNPFSLLDYKWSEYELTNVSWLLSNGAFHSGTVYKSVYELLLKIKNGTTTKAGVSVKLSTEAYADTDFVINTSNTTFRLPIKVKLASGNRVAGNGMTLGFTNGTQDGGFGQDKNNDLRAYTGLLGANVGSPRSGTEISQSNVSWGITTDPTKSGIETSSSGLYLYFYVGETIQDANVIAAGQVLTKVANSIDRTVKTDRETVIGWGMPDYTAGVTKSNDTVYTATKDIFVIAKNDGYYSYATARLFIYAPNGTELINFSNSGWGGGGSNEYGSVCAFIPKGFKYKVTFVSGQKSTIVEYPLKGTN